MYGNVAPLESGRELDRTSRKGTSEGAREKWGRRGRGEEGSGGEVLGAEGLGHVEEDKVEKGVDHNHPVIQQFR